MDDLDIVIRLNREAISPMARRSLYLEAADTIERQDRQIGSLTGSLLEREVEIERLRAEVEALREDAAALRLAVRLELELDLLQPRIAVRTRTGLKVLQDVQGDPLAATRLAINRTEAAIKEAQDAR